MNEIVLTLFLMLPFLVMPLLGQRSICLADYGTCPIPAEATQSGGRVQ